MGKQKPDVPTITLTKKSLITGNLPKVIEKLREAEVDEITSACRINKVVQKVRPLIFDTQEEYQKKVQKPYETELKECGIDLAKRPKRADLDEKQLSVLDRLNKEVEKQSEEFGEEEIEVDVIPLAPQHFKGIKISAADIEALGPLFDESGEVRQKAFQGQMIKGGQS